MKAIKLDNSWFSFRRCKGELQVCSNCRKKMQNKIGLSICKHSGHTKMNLWICLECIPEVSKMMVESLDKYADRIMAELI